MKVTLVNHSDTLGGASVVTVRLLDALRRAGVDARMVVVHKASLRSYVSQAGSAFSRKMAFLAEHARIFANNGFSYGNVFKVSIATAGLTLASHPWIKDADIVCLNWVNQGMLSIKGIEKIAAPIVWTMHDMWNMTGICHHAGDCKAFLMRCGLCPQLGSGARPDDISRRCFFAKEALYKKKNIHFVAVSNWLHDLCVQSPAMEGCDISVIPNAFPVGDFYTSPREPRFNLGLPAGPLVTMGAARLDDPIKGLDLAVETLNRLVNTNVKAVFFGALRDKQALGSLRIPYVHLGPLPQDKIAEILAHSSVVLSSSHYETLPGTLVEGLAAGAYPVAFDHGGQSDIVDHLSTGYLARYADTADLAKGIQTGIASAPDRESRHRVVAERFDSDVIARRYIDLFNSILSQK